MNKRNIYLMFAISLLQGMVFYASIATLYRQEAGLSIFHITIIESISLALSILLELPWGAIADKIGYRKTMIICSVLFFISKIIFWRAESFLAFLFERILLSVVFAGYSGVDASVVYLSCGDGDKQKVFSIYMYFSTLGLLISSVIFSVYIVDDYRLSALATVITYFVAMILTFALQEVKEEIDEDQNSENFIMVFKNFIKNKRLIVFLIAASLFLAGHQIITVFINQLQYIRCGMTNAFIGVAYTIMIVVSLLAVFSSKITRLIGKYRFINVIYVLSAISCLILAFTENAIVSICLIVGLRLLFNLFAPLSAVIENDMIVTKNRATALSVNALLANSVGIVANIIFGRVSDIDISYAFLLAMFFCIVGFVLVQIWKRMTLNITR